MAGARTQAPPPLTVASGSQATSRRWRHPFDTATGTVALGVLLTVVLFMALELLGG